MGCALKALRSDVLDRLCLNRHSVRSVESVLRSVSVSATKIYVSK
jgi:hypothetical protein